VNYSITFATEYLEAVRDRGLVVGSKGPTIRNGLWGIQWSCDWWRHVTLKGQTRDLNTLRAQYLENSWTGYFETIANH